MKCSKTIGGVFHWLTNRGWMWSKLGTLFLSKSKSTWALINRSRPTSTRSSIGLMRMMQSGRDIKSWACTMMMSSTNKCTTSSATRHDQDQVRRPNPKRRLRFPSKSQKKSTLLKIRIWLTAPNLNPLLGSLHILLGIVALNHQRLNLNRSLIKLVPTLVPLPTWSLIRLNKMTVRWK